SPYLGFCYQLEATSSDPRKPYCTQYTVGATGRQEETSAPTARRCAKALRHESLSSLQPAEMNHGSQSLLLHQADLCNPMSSQRIDDAPVKMRGRHFNRMTRYGSGIEAVEPTGTQVVPRTIDHN